jgi:hypothetical protein
VALQCGHRDWPVGTLIPLDFNFFKGSPLIEEIAFAEGEAPFVTGC